MKAISSKNLLLVVLLALVSLISGAAARSCSSILAPRMYQYSRSGDPFDFVSEIFRAPIYFNSLMKQQQEEATRIVRSTPRYAVSEENGMVQLEMEVPGVLAQDLQVELTDDKLLRIKGTRKYKVGSGGPVEESEFDLSFQLADSVDPDKMTVALSTGILRVQVPKKEKITKRIAIHTDVEDEVLEVKATQSSDDALKSTQISQEEVDGITIIDDDEST